MQEADAIEIREAMKSRDFRKVNLKPSDKKTVEFMLDSEDFSYVDFDYKTADCFA